MENKKAGWASTKGRVTLRREDFKNDSTWTYILESMSIPVQSVGDNVDLDEVDVTIELVKPMKVSSLKKSIDESLVLDIIAKSHGGRGKSGDLSDALLAGGVINPTEHKTLKERDPNATGNRLDIKDKFLSQTKR